MAKVELKAPIVDEIKGYVSDAKSAVLVDYRGQLSRIQNFVNS